jgi:hypothetical protein
MGRISRKSAAVLMLVAVIAMVGSGCAERQSKEQYGEQVEKLYVMRSQYVQNLSNTDSDDVSYYAKAQAKLRSAASDLESISPPKELEQAHDRHVEGLRGLSQVFGKLADCGRAEQRTPGAAAQCRRKIEQSDLDEVQNDLDEADAIYREAGYKVGTDDGE